mgnify:CR=1 FL=1
MFFNKLIFLFMKTSHLSHLLAITPFSIKPCHTDCPQVTKPQKLRHNHNLLRSNVQDQINISSCWRLLKMVEYYSLLKTLYHGQRVKETPILPNLTKMVGLRNVGRTTSLWRLRWSKRFGTLM